VGVQKFIFRSIMLKIQGFTPKKTNLGMLLLILMIQVMEE